MLHEKLGSCRAFFVEYGVLCRYAFGAEVKNNYLSTLKNENHR